MATPGEIIPADAPPIQLNGARRRTQLTVENRGDRSIQVGSHYHFFEVNRALVFDRRQALGMRLDIPAGMAVRFEPGAQQAVTLVAFGGSGRIVGFAALVNGAVQTPLAAQQAERRAVEAGFMSAAGDQPAGHG